MRIPLRFVVTAFESYEHTRTSNPNELFYNEKNGWTRHVEFATRFSDYDMAVESLERITQNKRISAIQIVPMFFPSE